MTFKELVKVALAAGWIAIGVHQFVQAAPTAAAQPASVATTPSR